MKFKLFVAVRIDSYDWEVAYAIIDTESDTEIIAALKSGNDDKVIKLLGWNDEYELIDVNDLGRWMTEAWLDAERSTDADEMYRLVCKARDYETSLNCLS
jgi:hypothetical protein